MSIWPYRIMRPPRRVEGELLPPESPADFAGKPSEPDTPVTCPACQSNRWKRIPTHGALFCTKCSCWLRWNELIDHAESLDRMHSEFNPLTEDH